MHPTSNNNIRHQKYREIKNILYINKKNVSLHLEMKHNTRCKYLILTYLLGMADFSVFRIANILVYGASAEKWPDFGGQLWHAMAIGLRFDSTVSCYLLILPLVLLLVSYLFDIKSKALLRSTNIVAFLSYAVALLACAADIPFFNYFFTRLNAVAMNEIPSFGIIASMIFSEPRYWLTLAGFCVFLIGYGIVQRKIYNSTLGQLAKGRKMPHGLKRGTAITLKIACSFLCLFVVFVGMRGGFEKRPIRVYSAHFCGDPFLNQLGINPVFSFIKSISYINSTKNQPLHYVDPATAQRIYDQERSTPIDSALAANAIVLPERTNVVLVIMESMSAAKLGELTPCLNSIIDQSFYFTHAYSAGVHTYNGIFSTLYSTPGVPTLHTMYHTFIPRMSGLPWALHNMGYNNAYFMPHDELYDNMEPFLYGNGFDSVVGLHSYDPALVNGTWGIPDHVLFDYALAHCNREAKNGPFFTTIMTCSDHTPYSMPTNIAFKPKSNAIEKQIIEYADWSIGRFIEKAKKESWFDNTVFAFIADHGFAWGQYTYDMALSYHHIPMIILCPKYIAPQRCDRIAQQTDLGPTLIGLLSSDYENTTFGIDLMRQRRKMAHFSSDDKMGVIDDEYYYIYHFQSKQGKIYHHPDLDPEDHTSEMPERAQQMKEYGLSLIQQTHKLIYNK